MFRFLKPKKETDALYAQCDELVNLIRPEVGILMSAAPGPANSAMAEFFGTLYFLWLAREKADWKKLRPYMAESALYSMFYLRRSINPKTIRKFSADARRYWRMAEKAEADLLKMGCSPLGWLSNRNSGLAGIAAGHPGFADQLPSITCTLIRRLELKNYEAYIPPVDAAPKPVLSDIRPQPPRPVEFINMADHHGNSVRMQVMDIITTADGTFACMRPENRFDLVVFKSHTHPDGRSVYCPADTKEEKLVIALFRTRNPKFFEDLPG